MNVSKAFGGEYTFEYKKALANVEIIIQEWIETAKEFAHKSV